MILPALQMPKSQGNLCCAQFGSGCGFPGMQGVASCKHSGGRKPGEKAQGDLSRLAKLHSNVPTPVPSTCQHGPVPGTDIAGVPRCPGDMQPPRQQPSVDNTGTK